MKLVERIEYSGHTLLKFTERFPTDSQEQKSHWLIVAPDGINIPGPPQPTEADARSFVDWLLRGADKRQPE